MRVLILVLASLFVSACSMENFIEAFMPEDARAEFDELVEAVDARDAEAMIAMAPADYDAELVTAQIEQMLAALPDAERTGGSLAGAHFSTRSSTNTGSASQASWVMRLDYPGESWRLEAVMVRIGDGDWTLNGADLTRIENQPVLSAAFTSPVRAFYMLLALALPVFILFTLVVFFRTPMVKRRILWTVFILVGYPTVLVNWTTLDITLLSPALHSTQNGVVFQFLDIAFFGAGYESGMGIEPTTLTLALPIGALFFWYRRSKGGPTRKSPVSPPAAGTGADDPA
jgi:hypothetical protein